MIKSGTKVAVLGAGKVGSTLAYRLVTEHLCDDLVLVDIDPQKAWAEATDLQHALGFAGHKMRVRAGSYYDCADADLCVLAVGTQFPPNTPRIERIDHAATIIGRIVPSVMATGFDGIFLVVTSPVDLMTWLVQQLSGLPDQQVIGTGTALDTARLCYYLADALDVPPRTVSAWVMGEHGGGADDPLEPGLRGRAAPGDGAAGKTPTGCRILTGRASAIPLPISHTIWRR